MVISLSKAYFLEALTDNDRGSKFHIKSGSWLSADMFIDCKDVQVLWMVKYKKIYAPDNNSYEGDVSADEIRVQYTYKKQLILLLQRLFNIYSRYYRKNSGECAL